MKIYDRRTKEYEETEQFGQGALAFLYGNPWGRLLLKLATSPIPSNLYAFWNGMPQSRKKIPDFIRDHGIDLSEFEDREYRSFNDFFTRKFREGVRPIDEDPDHLISPADAKLLVYPVDEATRMEIKGRSYSLAELTAGRMDLSGYDGGTCLVYRLCMEDHHRYCFPDDGKNLRQFRIKGKLHTVSSLSKEFPVYQENTRVISKLRTEHFGDVVHVEVGAMLVGRIQNRDVRSFHKGEEKGYFEPGGSTIIEVFKRGVMTVDEDIQEESANEIETKVRYGERIGRREGVK